MYGLVLDSNSKTSQYQQIYEQLRSKILQGKISSEVKMASTRIIAEYLKVSRSLIMEVIEQLKIEGFLEARRGSGTYVVPNLTYEHLLKTKSSRDTTTPSGQFEPSISFLAGIPDPMLFPRRRWNRMYQQSMEYADGNDFFYAPGQGRLDLRLALQDYLYRVKGINTSEKNIIITSGAAQAIHLLALIRKGGSVVLEDPLVPFVSDIFETQSYNTIYGKVDFEGIIPESIPSGPLDYIYCSPSHQFPLGGSLPATRRIELLKRATETGAFIIEDDYDGEYRYESRPIAAIQVLDPQQVIYVGTLSKILSPALRLAYMVIPDALIPAILELKRKMEFIGEGLQQAAMAKFISEGYLEKHLRSTIKIYNEKRNLLLNQLSKTFNSEIEINGQYTGLHLAVRWKNGLFEPEFQQIAREKGLVLKPVSSYSIRTKEHYDTLVIGFGLIEKDQIEQGINLLKQLM